MIEIGVLIIVSQYCGLKFMRIKWKRDELTERSHDRNTSGNLVAEPYCDKILSGDV